jgi:DNA-binding NarL/FixJ family response regulator
MRKEVPVLEWNELTEREQAVIARVAAGMTNRQIAEDMQLGVWTVKQHVSSALAKLGARNRTQAAVMALDANDPFVRDVVAGLRR